MDQFNPYDPALTDDPFPVLAQLRAQCPVSEPIPGFHVVTTYEDCTQALRDWHDFSSVGGASLSNDMPPETITINATDGTFHVRLRRMMQSVLRPVNYKAENDYIEGLAIELIEAFLPLGHVDVVDELAHKLPARVILKMIGVRDEDYKLVRGWTEEIEGATDPVNGIGMADFYSRRYPHPAVDAFDEYLQALLDDRRSGRVTADDLVARMVAFDDEDGQPFADNEIKSNLAFLLIAGNHTTGNLIGNLLSVLAVDPELYARMRADRTLVERAIEESLRTNSPVQGLFRQLTGDIEFHDAALHTGEKAYVHLASANRDDEIFEEPDRFDPDRPNLDKHVAFGFGVHFCIGAPLARLETNLALNAFMDRIESFELEAGAALNITTRSVANRGPSSLPIRFVRAG